MNNFISRGFLVGIFALTASTGFSQMQDAPESLPLLALDGPTRANAVMQDNEFDRSEVGQDANIFCNPLLLGGSSLDYETFGRSSTGVLSLSRGEPGSPHSTLIPFRVHLRRNGKLLEAGFSASETYKVELAGIMSVSRAGDLLIIDPVNKEDWKAKRILKILE